jgi:hypothetical protein
MAYQRETMISRRGYSGTGMSGMGGGVLDFITSLPGKVIDVFGAQQQAQGAAAQAQLDMQRALQAQQGGISTTDLLLIGGVGVAAFLLLRKKS